METPWEKQHARPREYARKIRATGIFAFFHLFLLVVVIIIVIVDEILLILKNASLE